MTLGMSPLVSWQADALMVRRRRLIARFNEAFRLTSRHPKSARQIIAEVAEKHGFEFSDMNGPWRERGLAEARQEAMYRMRHETKLSLTAIGRILNRDHSTVCQGVRAHEKRMREAQG